MNIIYDISVLGMAHYANRSRTGIARAIENILNQLLGNEECKIHFSALDNPELLMQALSYISSRQSLQTIPVCYPQSRFAYHLVQAARQIYPEPAASYLQRKALKAFSVALKRFKFLFRSLDQETLKQIDVLHSTFYPLPNYVTSSPGLKRFITIYDMIPVLFPEHFTPEILKLFRDITNSIRPDDWVLAISQSTKNDFCDYLKFDPARVFVTPLAASETFYRCTDKDKISGIRNKYRIPDQPYVLSLCTLEPRKNIDHTIRCFIEFARQHSNDLNLVLVGTKGWNFDKVFSEIENSADLKDRIMVTGYVPDEDLAALYSEAMMFVYPSFYEGFGLPPLEAMQCGVPVITSNTSSLPEVVGDAGIMVNPTDKDALCQAMLDIYSQPSLRDSLSAKSLERAKLFSWDKCAQQTVAAYKVAMGG